MSKPTATARTTPDGDAPATMERAIAAWPAPARSGADIDPLAPGLTVAHRGATVLCCSADGWIEGESAASGSGLFTADTRVISRLEFLLGGRRPAGAGLVDATAERWTAALHVGLPPGDAVGPRLPEDAAAVHIDRLVGPGMRERIVVVNHSMVPLETELEVVVGADFADVMELSGRWEHGGTTTAAWDGDRHAIELRHVAVRGSRRLERGVRISIAGADGDVRHELNHEGRGPHRLRFTIGVGPGGRWQTQLVYAVLVDGAWSQPADPWSGHSRRLRSRPARSSGHRLTVTGPDGLVGPAVAQAADDLMALRNGDLERELDQSTGPAWVPNAGVPRFTGFFGRDALTAGYQAAMVGPELMRGSVAYAARHQGRRDDPWSEEQPGRMVHEMRRGPLSILGIRPHAAYYGSHTTAAMFLIALTELWHWTGDRGVLERHMQAARDAIAWAERDGDLDGDGFLEYVSRSPDGLKNQGWKDSDEAIRHPDGRIVENPIATVEEQAFHYLALERMAEVHVVLGDDAAADACLARAARLRLTFERAYVLPDDGFLALGLGPDKRPIATIASNAGHALAAGILDPALAAAVARRLLASDLFTAWGVRSLSDRHPSYNAFAYHLGAIWPVENASFALGCKRYGLDAEAELLTDAIFRAAGHHHRLRLPEVIAGIGLEDSPVPVPYPRANRPQAWSASAVIQAVQVMLGIYPFAGAGILSIVRPRLPAWLPTLRVGGLRVGEAVVELDFERGADGSTHWQLVSADGPISVVGAPPPADAGASDTPGERLVRWGVDHMPGRTARALRIALGRETPALAAAIGADRPTGGAP